MNHLLSLLAEWVVPLTLAGIPIYGYWRKVPVYESFVAGAEEGIQMTWRILPFLLAILFAFGLFKDSGALDLLVRALQPLLGRLGLPGPVLPMFLVRPLSGNASLGILTSILKQHGPDSFVGRLASTLQGSTDTTFYILSVYFGSVGIRRSRHALAVGLAGDLAGFLASLVICRILFG